MSWLLNRWCFTSPNSLSGGVLEEAVWELEVHLVLLLSIELMGKSERRSVCCGQGKKGGVNSQKCFSHEAVT
ncbi:unnamed protein product [Bubo scandiacus]